MAFPIIETTSSGSTSGTTHSITLPSGLTAGDMVMVAAATSATGTTGSNAGQYPVPVVHTGSNINWKKLTSFRSIHWPISGTPVAETVESVFCLEYDGTAATLILQTETNDIASSQTCRYIAYRVSGATFAFAGSQNSGGSEPTFPQTVPDPVSTNTVTPNNKFVLVDNFVGQRPLDGNTNDFLSITVMSNDNTVPTNPPAGFSNMLTVTGNPLIASADKTISTAINDDPPAWDCPITTWVAVTISFSNTITVSFDNNLVAGIENALAQGQSVSYSADGSMLAVGGFGDSGLSDSNINPGTSLAVYNTSTWTVIPGAPVLSNANNQSLSGVDFSPDDVWLATQSSVSPYLRIYTTSDWNIVGGTPTLPGTGKLLEFSPDSSLLAIPLTASPFLRVLDTSDWSTVVGTPTLSSVCQDISWNSDGTLLACASTNTGVTVQVYETTGWTLVTDYTTPDSAIAIAFSPDDSELAIGHALTPFLTILETSGWTVIGGTPTLTGTGRSVGYNNTGTLFAVGHFTSPFFEIYDRATWAVEAYSPTLYNIGDDIEFKPDGTEVAIGSFLTPGVSILPIITNTISVDSKAFTLSTNIIGINDVVAANTITFTLATTNTLVNDVVGVDTYVFTLTTLDAAVGIVEVATATFSLSTLAVDFTVTVLVDTASFALTTYEIATNDVVLIDLTTFTINTTLDHTILGTGTIVIDAAQLTLTTQVAGVNDIVAIDTASFTLTTLDNIVTNNFVLFYGQVEQTDVFANTGGGAILTTTTSVLTLVDLRTTAEWIEPAPTTAEWIDT